MAEHIPTAAHVRHMTEEQILLFCDVLAMIDDASYRGMHRGMERRHDGFPRIRYSTVRATEVFTVRYGLDFTDDAWHFILSVLPNTFRFCGLLEHGVACIVDDNVGTHESTLYIVTSFLTKLHQRMLTSLGTRGVPTANALLRIAADIASGELTAADFQEMA